MEMAWRIHRRLRNSIHPTTTLFCNLDTYEIHCSHSVRGGADFPSLSILHNLDNCDSLRLRICISQRPNFVLLGPNWHCQKLLRQILYIFCSKCLKLQFGLLDFRFSLLVVFAFAQQHTKRRLFFATKTRKVQHGNMDWPHPDPVSDYLIHHTVVLWNNRLHASGLNHSFHLPNFYYVLGERSLSN